MVGKCMTVAIIAAITIAATACGGGDDEAGVTVPSAAATTAASPSPSVSGPIGIVAIGHSGLTGENADPNAPDRGAPKYSWATGDDPAVRSIYQRLVAQDPEWGGHVANRAKGGARAETLGIQAQSALEVVPSPALVIVQTIDNDIACDGSDAAHVPEVGASIERAVRYITERSPDARILILTALGRPATYAAAFASNPSARAAATSSSSGCSLFDAAGNVDDAVVAKLTAIIEAYEAEQARVCAMFAQCSIVDVSGFEDRLDLLSSDYAHLAPVGLALVADAVWPSVARALGVPE